MLHGALFIILRLLKKSRNKGLTGEGSFNRFRPMLDIRQVVLLLVVVVSGDAVGACRA